MPGTIAHDTTTSATAARTMLTSRSVPFAPLRISTLTVVPASPRTQPATSSRSWPLGRLAVDLGDLVTRLDSGLLGRAALEDLVDDRKPVVGRVDPDADSDVRARQLVGPRGPLLGRQERGVAGVADRLGQPVDRAVGQGPVVELVLAHVLLVEDVPGLADQRELLRGGRIACRVRGRVAGAALGGRHQAPNPDPDSERQREREPDGRPADRRPASSAGRR